MDWFSADFHLGHANIIKYCKRPFNNILNMDAAILHNLFSSIKKGDTLYFLGDLSFNRQAISNFLNACLSQKIKLIFIKGNHDKLIIQGSHQALNHVQNLKSISIDRQPIILCHYALRVWDRSHYGSWNLHGHSHGTLDPKGLQYDVGVDNNNFMPVSFLQLKKIIEKKSPALEDYYGTPRDQS